MCGLAILPQPGTGDTAWDGDMRWTLVTDRMTESRAAGDTACDHGSLQPSKRHVKLTPRFRHQETYTGFGDLP